MNVLMLVRRLTVVGVIMGISTMGWGMEDGEADETGRKAKTPQEIFKFNATRMEALRKQIGGTWQLAQTKHFYLFSNIPPEHLPLLQQHVEHVFDRMKGYLEIDEDAPIWHNKCALYLFGNRARFEKFAKTIAQYPKGAESGGFFVHEGREAIVADLFDDKNFSKKEQVRQCLNGVSHDVGEAIMQLAGYNEILSPWLRNGMNVFIEFALENERFRTTGTMKARIKSVVSQKVSRGAILGWEEGHNRPDKYTDLEGYGFAYTRIAFFHLLFPDKKKIPRMINLIKLGGKEKDAMEQVFKKKTEELEAAYRQWIGPAIKSKMLFR